MKHSYDPKCEELAIHFLAEENPSRGQIEELAQLIQDAVEDAWGQLQCYNCGCEERDHRGLLTCRCPARKTA